MLKFMRGMIIIFNIKAFPAYDGDCFLISYGEGNDIRNIVVDGGRRRDVVKKLKKEIKEIESKDQVIDLMVLTHIDNDHIYGLLKLFEDESINGDIVKKIWFNSKEILAKEFDKIEIEDDTLQIMDKSDNKVSYKQGISLAERLKQLNIECTEIISSGHLLKLGEANLIVISPDLGQLEKLYNKWDKEFQRTKDSGAKISSSTKDEYNKRIDELFLMDYQEDNAVINGSSIAFCLEYKGRRLLMLGDAHPSTITKNLKYIKDNDDKIHRFDLIKLSHHGSKYNISAEFLEKVSCRNYLVSTNGKTHGLPNKETLVKVAKKENGSSCVVYFNYDELYQTIFTEEEMAAINIKCIEPNDMKKEILVVNICKLLGN
ncbi:hypothetical protein CON22_24980 [Bacillus cereus]|nr:hypothetical protein CON22_24980 [Bacillus cereus]